MQGRLQCTGISTACHWSSRIRLLILSYHLQDLVGGTIRLQMASIFPALYSVSQFGYSYIGNDKREGIEDERGHQGKERGRGISDSLDPAADEFFRGILG